jgi:hypothetical protein
MFPSFVLTDGAQYVAEQAGAYWLMDLIGSYQYPLLPEEPFQVWVLTAQGKKGKVVADDGNGRILVSQEIPYTDFPLEQIKLYAIYDGSYLVILLPSEY